jgi:hypothetical protein
MKSSPENSWRPSHELLGAYADGELDGVPELDGLCAQVEQWLSRHPEAEIELNAQRELARLMSATSPPLPSSDVWKPIWAGVVTQRPVKSIRWRAAAWLAGMVVFGSAAALVLFAISNGGGVSDDSGPQAHAPHAPGLSERQLLQQADMNRPGELRPSRFVSVEDRPMDKIDVLPVATADEIEIVRISGCDTCTLLVGRPPVAGTVVLLMPNEVEVKLPANDPAGPGIRIGGSGNPMIWTPQSEPKDDGPDR